VLQLWTLSAARQLLHWRQVPQRVRHRRYHGRRMRASSTYLYYRNMLPRFQDEEMSRKEVEVRANNLMPHSDFCAIILLLLCCPLSGKTFTSTHSKL